MMTPAFWWAVAGIGLMLCEFALPGLILFFFGVGALVTALAAWLFPLSFSIQLIVFIIASLASLFGLRRTLKSVFTGKTADPRSDALEETLAGETGTAETAIAPGHPGKVRLHGTAWTAESEEEIEAGRPVVVTGQESLTLFVKNK